MKAQSCDKRNQVITRHKQSLTETNSHNDKIRSQHHKVNKTQSKRRRNDSNGVLRQRDKFPTTTDKKPNEQGENLLNKQQQREWNKDWVPVSWFADKPSSCKFANWPNSAGMGPGYTKPSQIIQKTSYAIVLVRFHWERKPMPWYYRQVRAKKDGVPVSWFSFKCSTFKFANRPNSAGMGPGVYKTQSKHTKNKSRYRSGAKGHKESKPIPS
jgi:hypothetical protein